jgi:hypothetical protein
VEWEIETKAQTFRYRSLLSEENQNVLIWSAYYRNKSRTFQSVPKLFKIESEHFGVFKVQKRNQNETELISYQIKTFPYTHASEETKRNFCELFPNFFKSSERFCLLQAVQESKQNFCIFKKLYQNEAKTLQIAPGFSKDKTKLFVVPKKIWKRTRTKAFGPNFSSTDRKHFVSIQNFVLKTFTFDLFWNESSKTEASDLERSLI